MPPPIFKEGILIKGESPCRRKGRIYFNPRRVIQRGKNLSGIKDKIMEELKQEHLQFIEDKDDLKGQWVRSTPVFEHFFAYLQKKGLKPQTIAKKINSVVLFIMNHVYREGQLAAMNEVTGEIISDFMEGWYSINFPESRPQEEKEFRKAILDFFTFLNKMGLINKGQLADIRSMKMPFPPPPQKVGLPVLVRKSQQVKSLAIVEEEE